MGSSWKVVPSHLETYTRPLGSRETGFACNALHGGTDITAHATIATPASESAILFSKANVHRSWLGLKKKYPLIGAKIVERQHLTGFDFVVSEEMSDKIGPEEIIFMSAYSDEEAVEIVHRSLKSERVLSSDLLGVLWLISVIPNSESMEQPISLRTWHLACHISHCISDITAVSMKVASFLDILTGGVPSEHESFQERLSSYPCVEHLNPSRYDLAKLRWRRAAAAIIDNTHLIGEQPMPRKKTNYTPETPVVVSGVFSFYFTREATKNILATCHEAGVTLGSTMPVLLQIAYARLFHRLHAQGFSHTEWNKAAWQFLAPVNMRPFLDPVQFNPNLPYGGCAISVYNISLPRIPMPATNMDKPSYDDFITQEHFLYRCELSQKQSKRFLKHPLLVEIAEVREKNGASMSKASAMWWRDISESKALGLSAGENYTLGIPYQFSAAGDLAKILPSTYPLIHKASNVNIQNQISPSLWLKDISYLLRCLPHDLYLTSLTYDGTMRFILIADITSYDQAMVQELLNYVGEAAEWYLGSRRRAGSQTNTCTSKL